MYISATKSKEHKITVQVELFMTSSLSKKENAILLYFESLSNKHAAIIFYLIGTLTEATNLYYFRAWK